jgi:hypothetical protein
MHPILIPLLLTCGPATLSSLAVVRTVKEYRGGQLRMLPLTAVGGAWLITAYAAYTFLRYTVSPSPDLPPWKDPETLDLALLFLLAPVGLAFTVIAGRRGASKWVVIPLVVALMVLFLVGLLEGASV